MDMASMTAEWLTPLRAGIGEFRAQVSLIPLRGSSGDLRYSLSIRLSAMRFPSLPISTSWLTRPEGLRAEAIRESLGLRSKGMPRILKEGVATKRLKFKGEKRARTYFAA